MDNYVILCLKKRRKSNDKVIGTTQYLIILCVTVFFTVTFYKGGGIKNSIKLKGEVLNELN